MLTGNHLTGLPHGVFANLTRLSSLYLNLNNLTTVDAKWFVQIPPMGDLKLLDLTQNNIAEIDYGMHQFW